MSHLRAFKKIRALGEDVVEVLDARLLEGESCLEMARWIQNDVGKLNDIKTESLKKMLERYRERELRRKTLERITNAQKNQSLAKIHKRLNAMETMAGLVEQQQLRVGRILAREDQLPSGLLLKDANNEIRLLKDMLVDLGRLQLETGVLHRAPKKVMGSIMKDGEEHTFEWTEAQERLFSELENHVMVIEGEATEG